MSNVNLLIIDDDITFTNQLSCLLKNNDFQVDHCTNSEQGLLQTKQYSYQLIILAVSMPSLSGFVVLEKLRNESDIPVIMLCHGYKEEDRLVGYRKGADDYLSKSFSLAEILLRIKSLLRRTLSTTCNSAEEIEVSGLILNKRVLSVSYRQQNISLTPIQFRLLWVLVESNKRILSKSYLYQTVLDRDFSQYDRTLDMHLSRIRKKLLEIGMQKERLKTVHGKGYLFS